MKSISDLPSQQISLKERLVEIIHLFYARGWSLATSTNYSFRNPVPYDDTYCISKSGIDKGRFSSEDLMDIDSEGKATAAYAGLRSSAETLLHTLLYEDSDTQAVLHTHSANATVLSQKYAEAGQITWQGYEMIKGIEGNRSHENTLTVPIFANSQDMPALSKEIRQYYEQQPSKVPAFLLAGHGLYAWGNSLEQAQRHLETIEFLLDCQMKQEQLT